MTEGTQGANTLDNPQKIVDDGVEFEVVWSGKDPLLAPRATKPDLTWEPPRRLYNRKPSATIVVNVTGTGPSLPEE